MTGADDDGVRESGPYYASRMRVRLPAFPAGEAPSEVCVMLTRLCPAPPESQDSITVPHGWRLSLGPTVTGPGVVVYLLVRKDPPVELSGGWVDVEFAEAGDTRAVAYVE